MIKEIQSHEVLVFALNFNQQRAWIQRQSMVLQMSIINGWRKADVWKKFIFLSKIKQYNYLWNVWENGHRMYKIHLNFINKKEAYILY